MGNCSLLGKDVLDSAQARQFSKQLLASGELDGWKLKASIGAGKSAVVFKALRDGQRAALKVFHPELVERYGIEAQKIRIDRERGLIGTSHPNLVDILDGGICKTHGHPYVAMELVEGSILSEALDKIPRNAIAPIIEQMARGAKHLEDMGLVHRDIKPDNIMLLGLNPPRIKLLDFGVLRPIGDNSATDQPGHRSFVGTHQYCPPEMVHLSEEDSVDGWRAISFYQIGAVLHDLIMRKRIFSEYEDAIGNLVVAIDSNRPAISAPDVPAEICDLAKRCLLKKPQERTRLVAWSEFAFSERSASSTVQDRKDRLLKRQQTLAAHAKADPLNRIEVARLDQHRLGTIVRALRKQFDSALDSFSNNLPPRTLRLLESAFPDAALHCTFPSDAKLGIANSFHIQTTVAVTDPASNVVEVYARAGKGESPNEIGWMHLGGFVDDLGNLGPALEGWLLEILEEIVDEQGVA